MPPKKAENKSKYVKKDPISHILDRPDMYVGSLRPKETEEFVCGDDFKIYQKKVNISPALLRIFIEPLSNVIDNVARSRASGAKLSKIEISVDKKTGETTFINDGEVIPVELHPEEKCYNHTMIFGQLLTSSNYDDTEDREDISGKNGLGGKATNVFSKTFSVEGADPVNKKLFRQEWRNNMKETSEPKITSYKLARGYTKVIYFPDFQRFGIKSYTDDIIALFKKYAVDCAMITKVKTFFNGEEIPCTNLCEYAKLYGDTEETLSIKTKDCEVVLTPSDEFQAISFANGIHTPLGGTHVDSWTEGIFRPIVEKLNKPKKPQINIGDIKKYFRLFVCATVKKPEFDSQSKRKLEGPEVKADVKKTHITAITKWSVMERLEDIIRLKEMVVLKKSERKKRGYEKVEGLDPANNEGGTKGKECTLILVEGLSAKTYAVWGIQEGAFGKTGRDWFGIYALRGKVLNCRKAKPVTIAKNHVVSDIIKALGISYGVDYTNDDNFNKLRYGRVMIITDADVDGLHISGLLQNMFHALFPTLLQRKESFLTCMQTPIVRVFTKGEDKVFYDENEYRDYVKANDGKKINKKYYKGLGTNKEEDVADTFGKKLVQFVEDEQTLHNMNKVFSDDSSVRKTWLDTYDPNKRLVKWNGNKPEKVQVSFSDFINTELIKFSVDDCKRSLPNLFDGLKEGHRKVLYICLSENLKYTGKSMKVAQLASLVALKTEYHHGEQNLESTITSMANCFVGSNNVPLLYRDGQFGSRDEGGKDAAAGRYIFTKLDYLTRLLFRQEDDPLLNYLENDGTKVEPEYYVPILPTILINGCIVGIGTGWSCSVPCYNPLNLINCVKIWLDNGNKAFIEEDGSDIKMSLFPDLTPWYRGFKGEIKADKDGKFISLGNIEKDPKGKVLVSELPIGLWTSKFTETLEEYKTDKKISNYKNYCTPKEINYVITESSDGIKCTHKSLGLEKKISTSNMVLWADGQLKKFNSPEEILDYYCGVRYNLYTKRKAYQLNGLEKDIKYLGNKRRFLQEVRDGEIKLFTEKGGKKVSRKTLEIEAELEERGYDKTTDTEEKDDEETESKGGYNYLLRLQINSITAEKIDKLKKDIDSKIKLRDELKSKTEKDLWLSDLEEFQIEYEKWLSIIDKEKPKKKKKTN
jgi:DNA topoisomerase-2